MKLYYGDKNVGDTLSPIILEHFTSHTIERVGHLESGKLLMVGSYLDIVENGDILLGVGSNKENFYLEKENLNIISLRGKLTAKQIKGCDIDLFGDPALLLPFIYQPKINKKRKLGVIPHYIDWDLFKGKDYIDISLPWKQFIDEVVSCEEVISSSLHGIVIAEAYGIPAKWAVYSNKIAGGEFKYHDYFLGTNRINQRPFTELEKIPNLQEIQDSLIKALKSL